jgi:hypothetical protein
MDLRVYLRFGTYFLEFCTDFVLKNMFYHENHSQKSLTTFSLSYSKEYVLVSSNFFKYKK